MNETSAAVDHVLSVTGQVAAALPPIVVLIVLSRSAGLETAGVFTITAGISAAAFSAALWGLRSAVVLDGLRTRPAVDYLAARAVAFLLAAIAVGVTTQFLHIEAGLVAGLVLYKVCDGLADLDFAVTQVNDGTRPAFRSYALLQVAKLLLLLIAMMAAARLPDVAVGEAFAISGIAVLLLLAPAMLRRTARGGFAIRRIGAVFAAAGWFALAAASCAIVTSAPRISLGWLYQGESLGVVGTSLSAGTFFGMILFTTWARHLPGFRTAESFRSGALRFLGETAALTVAAAIVSWLLLPPVLAWLFAFTEPSQTAIARSVLVASVFFFAGMATCNLYKATGRAWLEAVSYLLALGLAIVLALTFEAFRDMARLLAAAGLVMLACGLLSLRVHRTPSAE